MRHQCGHSFSAIFVDFYWESFSSDCTGEGSSGHGICDKGCRGQYNGSEQYGTTGKRWGAPHPPHVAPRGACGRAPQVGFVLNIRLTFQARHSRPGPAANQNSRDASPCSADKRVEGFENIGSWKLMQVSESSLARCAPGCRLHLAFGHVYAQHATLVLNSRHSRPHAAAHKDA